MIKYKRIYPLKQGGRLAAIVTAIGTGDSCEIFVKFKMKPKEKNLLLILFCPKTYDYVMLPLEERMQIDRSVTALTGCIIGCRNGMFIEFLMDGSVNKARLNTSKLKSIIAMDSINAQAPKAVAYEEPITETVTEEIVETIVQPTAEPETVAEKEDNTELMDYLKQMEEGTLPLTFTQNPDVQDTEDASPVATESSASVTVKEETVKVHVADEILRSVHAKDEEINIPKEFDEINEKYCEFINPFNGRWDGVWWKVQYPDKNWHYIVGRIVVDGAKISVLGVPGDRGKKPVCLDSCDMYAISDNGVGYWLMFQK